jgi:hypothetical protein
LPVNSRPTQQKRASLLQQKRPTKIGRATICNRQNNIVLMFAIQNESPQNIRHPASNCKQKLIENRLNFFVRIKISFENHRLLQNSGANLHVSLLIPG